MAKKIPLITNFRYGDKIVKRVYLGKKKVWECDFTKGETALQTIATASTQMPTLNFTKGEAFHTTRTDNPIQVDEAILSFGLTDSVSLGKATIHLGEILFFSSFAKHNIINKAIVEPSTALQMNSDIQTQVFNKGHINMSLSTNLLEELQIITTAGSATCGVDTILELVGQIQNEMHNSGIGNVFAVISSQGNSQDYIKISNALAGISMDFHISSTSEIHLDSTNTTKQCKALFIKSEASSRDYANAFYDLLNTIVAQGIGSLNNFNGHGLLHVEDVIFLVGNVNLNSHSLANPELLPSIWVTDSNKIYTVAYGVSTKYILISTYSDQLETTNNYGSAILWYPPIGDDIPLGEADNIDITIDGNTLEIQQAFEVFFDEENSLIKIDDDITEVK